MPSTSKNVWMSLKAPGYSQRTIACSINLLIAVQKKVGTIAKDQSTGPFVDEWKKAFGDISKEVEEVDISVALSSAAFAVKDENELVRLCGVEVW